MKEKTVCLQTTLRKLVIPARASRITFLCGLCALCGEFFGSHRTPEEENRPCIIKLESVALC
jgi:hypothetical protein